MSGLALSGEQILRRGLYEWIHLAVEDLRVTASNGLVSLADQLVANAPPLDRVFVFAGGTPAAYRDNRCFQWLRQQARQGLHMGGVSGGPYLLASAGLMHGYRMTIHWEHISALQEEFPDLTVDPGLFVIDRGRMTCAGGTAGLDLALALIEQDHGAVLARHVAEWFIKTEQRSPDLAQRLGLRERYDTRNARLLAMLAAMEGAVDTPLPREDLAAAAGVSVRQLERLCVRHFARSISELYLGIRLDHGVHLLRSTSLSVTEISILSGFATASHFSRCFKARHGHSPSQWKSSSGSSTAGAPTRVYPEGRLIKS